MATSRFYLPAEVWNPESLALVGAEAHHCKNVMRYKVGDRVIAFNGEGTEIEGEITGFAGKVVHLKPLITVNTERPPSRLVLGQAIPKGKNMDLIIEKATELGASEVIPLLSDRTVVKLDAKEALKKQEKWQRLAIEACKQCGQNWLPKIATPMTVDRFLKTYATDGLRLVAALQDDTRPLHEILDGKRPAEATVLIGPEGDFTPAEVSSAVSAGYAPLSLGPIVLRSETAAIYSLSILGYELMRS